MLIRKYFASWENPFIETQRRKCFGIEIANLVKLPTFEKNFPLLNFIIMFIMLIAGITNQ